MAFTEQPEAIFEVLKPFFEREGVRYEVSDCTPASMKERLIHIEFLDTLSEQQKSCINTEIDRIYEEKQNKAAMRYDVLQQARQQEAEELEVVQ